MKNSQENFEEFMTQEELENSFLIEKEAGKLLKEEMAESFLFEDYLKGLTLEELDDLINSPLSLKLNPQLIQLSAAEIHQKAIEERAKRWQSNIKNTVWPFNDGKK